MIKMEKYLGKGFLAKYSTLGVIFDNIKESFDTVSFYITVPETSMGNSNKKITREIKRDIKDIIDYNFGLKSKVFVDIRDGEHWDIPTQAIYFYYDSHEENNNEEE